MIASVKRTREILNTYQEYAKKSFGQNFLIDGNIIQKIIQGANILPNSLVVEIGPGLGALTEHLSKHAKKVLAFEIDPNMVEILKDTLRDCNNVKVVLMDILKADIQEEITPYLEEGIEHIYCIANLPYYITTPIIVRLLESEIRFEKFVFMVQKEVGKRFAGSVSTKEYNALSVLMQYKTKVQVLFDVSKDCFMPAPNVESVVIEMVPTPFEVQARNQNFFYGFIKSLFSSRRKTIVNNLNSSYKVSKEMIQEILLESNIKIQARAEELSVIEIVQLCDSFYERMKVQL